jgi:hypothetical protein
MAYHEFSDDQEILMQEILEGYLHELTSEIFRTDTPSFRDDLKKKRELVKDMLGSFHEKAA